MSQKYRRYSLKTKEAKQILTQASTKLNLNLDATFSTKPNVETAETDSIQIIVVNQKPLFYKTGENVYPTLLATEIIAKLPKIVVDMGAVPHVCNGADIMAPGIVRYESEFNKGAIVTVSDEKHGKLLAIGETLLNSTEAKTAKKGLVIKNLHYVGDEIWNLIKILT